MAAGASHVRFADFLSGTLLGMAPGILLITLFGYGLEGAIHHPSWGTVLLPIAVIVVLTFGILIARKQMFTDRDGSQESDHEKKELGT
jgi:uncharacterized membrane protein YdjX (TVP38/TMEM64 family)